MPKGKKPVAGFKPGQSGNPGGRPKMPDDVKAIRLMDKIEYARKLHKFMNMERDELGAYLAGPGVPLIDEYIGAMVLSGAEHADPNKLETLLRRYIGPVKDEVEISQPKPLVIERADGSSRVLGSDRDLEGDDND